MDAVAARSKAVNAESRDREQRPLSRRDDGESGPQCVTSSMHSLKAVQSFCSAGAEQWGDTEIFN